jgi:tetraacyldisaccharide 4'-kinase
VKPAVLLRGYKVGASADSDEREMLASALGADAVVAAGPSRSESAGRVLSAHRDVGAFLLDDGFQHRKVARDFDVVLVNAADPFGFGRVLPRGLLREPLCGLRRADAVVLTRADQVSGEALAEVKRTVRRYNPDVPIYRASHAHVGLRSDEGVRPLDLLRETRFFAFAGIGNPDSFGDQLRRHAPGGYAGHRWFWDHHDYSQRDLDQIRQEAERAGASVVVTTEKDWVKVSRAGTVGLPVYRLELDVRFQGDDGGKLLGRVLDALGRGHH